MTSHAPHGLGRWVYKIPFKNYLLSVSRKKNTKKYILLCFNFRKKVAILAQLVRSSSNFMAYTGAGISTTAGIDDYASKKSGKQSKLNENRKKVKKPRYAKPTLGHRVLTELYHTGNLKHWVQQVNKIIVFLFSFFERFDYHLQQNQK